MCQMYMLVDTCNMNYLAVKRIENQVLKAAGCLEENSSFFQTRPQTVRAEELSRDSIKICNVLQSHSFKGAS